MAKKLKITVQVGKEKRTVSTDRIDEVYVRQLTRLLAKQAANMYTKKQKKK